MIRRTEYRDESLAGLHEVLDAVRYGHLATTDDRGCPVVKPLNFARIGDHLYFHRARPGEMSAQLGRPACFVATDALAWVPSSVRHPELACPATTYYRSVVVHGTPEVVEDPVLKAASLMAFMRRYQPEGGYRPITADDPLYRGPIQGVLVFRLSLENASTKLKVGQNLDHAQRATVFAHLAGRGELRAARAMQRVDPALGYLPAGFTDDPARIPADQLKRLLDGTYWADGRSVETLRALVDRAYVAIAALDGERLVGFARAFSDGVLYGSIHDVVVDPAYRGNGLGRRMMEALLAHPLIARLPSLGLSTLDRMRFYESFGFKVIGATQAPFGVSTQMRLARGKPCSGEPVEQPLVPQQLVGGAGAGRGVALAEPRGAEHGGERGHLLPPLERDAGQAPAVEVRLDRAAGGSEPAGEPAGPAQEAGHAPAGAAGESRRP